MWFLLHHFSRPVVLRRLNERTSTSFSVLEQQRLQRNIDNHPRAPLAGLRM